MAKDPASWSSTAKLPKLRLNRVLHKDKQDTGNVTFAMGGLLAAE